MLISNHLLILQDNYLQMDFVQTSKNRHNYMPLIKYNQLDKLAVAVVHLFKVPLNLLNLNQLKILQIHKNSCIPKENQSY